MIHVIRPAHSDQIQFIAGLSLFSNFAKVQTSQTSHQSYQMNLTKLFKALFPLHSLQLIAVSLRNLPLPRSIDCGSLPSIDCELPQQQILAYSKSWLPLFDCNSTDFSVDCFINCSSSTAISLPWQLLYRLQCFDCSVNCDLVPLQETVPLPATSANFALPQWLWSFVQRLFRKTIYCHLCGLPFSPWQPLHQPPWQAQKADYCKAKTTNFEWSKMTTNSAKAKVTKFCNCQDHRSPKGQDHWLLPKRPLPNMRRQRLKNFASIKWSSHDRKCGVVHQESNVRSNNWNGGKELFHTSRSYCTSGYRRALIPKQKSPGVSKCTDVGKSL